MCLGIVGHFLFVCNTEQNSFLQPFAWDKDEEHTKCCNNQESDRKDHDGPFDEELTNVRFTDSREIERRVLAQADESKDRIQGVLVRGKEVDANSEGKNELQVGQQVSLVHG